MSVHIILEVLRYLRAIDPRVVVGVPREEFDDAVLHVALDALPVKLGLHEDALGVTADQVCYLLGREFGCEHRLDWEKHTEELGSTFSGQVLLVLQLFEN
jgi:hypothetical protein